MAIISKQIYSVVLAIVLVISLSSNLCFGHSSGSGASQVHEDYAHHHCDHGHHHHHEHNHHHDEPEMAWEKKLPEELAEEEDLKLLGFGSYSHDHEHQDYGQELAGFGNSMTLKL